jgi:hypothetical protein
MNIRDGESYGDIGISKLNRTESFNLEVEELFLFMFFMHL